jgi:hypothetical protein
MFAGGPGEFDTCLAELATPKLAFVYDAGHFAVKRLIVGYWTLVG